MAWTPNNTVIDEAVLIANLKAYIEANQTDALLWAVNGGDALDDFAAVYSTASGRIGSLFPSLMFIRTNTAERNGDILEAAFSTTIEGEIIGSDPDEIGTTARIYGTAVKSMLENIPVRSLTAGALTDTTGFSDTIETEFDILRGSKGATSFLQIFQIRVTYLLKAAAQ